MTNYAFTFRTWPFYWLTRATGRYLRNMEHALKPHSLDIPQWRVLMTLHEAECLSVSEIADHAIAKLSTMTKIVRRMEADELVHCRQRETDARVTEVLLTPGGQAAGELAWQVANTVYKRAFRNLSKREIDTLNLLLMKVAENLKVDE